jgi:hypothetical protein
MICKQCDDGRLSRAAGGQVTDADDGHAGPLHADAAVEPPVPPIDAQAIPDGRHLQACPQHCRRDPAAPAGHQVAEAIIHRASLL